MNLFYYKITAGLVLFLITAMVIIYPIRLRAYPKHNRPLELADAFASGIFLGAGLFHMLPDAIKSFSLVFPDSPVPIAEFLCAGGFLLLLFLERLSNFFAAAHQKAKTFSYMLIFILVIHALIEGTVLGVNNTLTAASVIFIAILAHKSSESFALAVSLNRSEIKLSHIIFIIILFSLMTPLGIVLGTYFSDAMQSSRSQFLTAGFNAFAAGTFLYMSTLHHVNHHHSEHESENLFEFGALFVGLVVMGVLGIWS